MAAKSTLKIFYSFRVQRNNFRYLLQKNDAHSGPIAPSKFIVGVSKY